MRWKRLLTHCTGTVVDWRTTVTSKLISSASSKIASYSSSGGVSPDDRSQVLKLENQDWTEFSQDWRDSYKAFVHDFVPGETEWRDIDTHHYLSLLELLEKQNLDGIYTKEEVKEISLVWHFLDPWKDSSVGIHQLNSKFITSTLSNGNQSLLQDLEKHGNLGFNRLQSGADFRAYKPSPIVYTGAASAMGLDPGEVAMVAAHLSDLKAAKECGFQTIYVERKQEEDWGRDQKEYHDAASWVDMWVTEDEDGFIEVARRFGC